MSRPAARALAGALAAALAAALPAPAPAEERPPIVPEPWRDQALPDDEAGRQARDVLPFTPDQIRRMVRLLDQVDRAANRPPDPPPRGRVRRVRASVAADAPIPAIEVRRGFATVVGVTDLTGAPWPIEEALVDEAFLPREARSGTDDPSHLLYLAPRFRGLSGNLALKLHGLVDPLVVALVDTGGPAADFRVELRMGRPGPMVDAAALVRPASLAAGETGLMALLGGHVPDGAASVRLEGADPADRAWRAGADLLLVTRHVLLSPGPWAAERGSGGRWAYRLPDTPSLWLSLDGRETRVRLAAGDAEGSAP